MRNYVGQRSATMALLFTAEGAKGAKMRKKGIHAIFALNTLLPTLVTRCDGILRCGETLDVGIRPGVAILLWCVVDG